MIDKRIDIEKTNFKDKFGFKNDLLVRINKQLKKKNEQLKQENEQLRQQLNKIPPKIKEVWLDD